MSHIFARHIHLNSWFYFVGRCENSLARNFVSTSDTEIFEHFHTGVQYALCHFLLSHTHTHTSCECHFHFYLHLNHLIFMHCAHSWACFFPRCLFIFDTIRKLKKNKPRNKIIKEKKNTQNNLCSLTTWSRRKQLKNEKNEMTFQKGEKKKQQQHKDVNVWSAIFFSRTLQNAIRYRTNSSKWKITTFGEKRILYAANIKSNQIWCTWSVSAWLFKWTNQKKGRYKT